MRLILVDHARARGAVKRGRDWKRVPDGDLSADFADARLLDLDEALDRLAAEDPLVNSFVEPHRFAGLPHEQAAEALGIALYLPRLKWDFAPAWLESELDFP
jgi:hypothetical protein